MFTDIIMAKGKGKKHPYALKFPLTAYMEFVKEERPKVLLELGLAPSQVGAAGKELGRRWHALTVEERKKFEERSKANRMAYKKEVEKIGAANPRKIKKPLSSFMQFAKVERSKVVAEVGVLAVGDMGKELGRRWRNLSMEEKAAFEDKCREDKKKYEAEIEELEPKSAESAAVVPSENRLESSEVNAETDRDDNDILAADLGFAKQKFYSWHPALRTGTMSRGTRIKVTYFGTAETGTVDRNKWLPYSEPVEARIVTSRLMKDSGFMKALDQMKNMLVKINSSDENVKSSTGVGFSALPVGRKLVKLTKEGLKKDEEQNNRFMKERIVETHEHPYKWKCLNCPWKGKYLHKAKSHARDCGSRVKEQKKRSKAEKYECSVADCSMSFALMTDLQKHYRASHYQQSQGHYCILCKLVFTNWSNFKRHNVTKHGARESVSCEFCDYKSDRMDNLSRHMKKQHGIRQTIASLVSDIVNEVVEQIEVEDDVLDDKGMPVVRKQLDGVRELSEYEKLKVKRVAEIEAEFKKMFPELAKLKRPRKKTAAPKVRKVVSGVIAGRRSSRASARVGRALEVEKAVGEEVQEVVLDEADGEIVEVGDHTDNVENVNEAGDLAVAVDGAEDQEVSGGGDREGADAQFKCHLCAKSFRDTPNLERHNKLIHHQRETPLQCPRTWCCQEFYIVAELREHKDNCWLVCPYEGCPKTFKRERFFAAHQRAHKIMDKRMMD